MPAMPQVISANNSPRCMRASQGRTSSGASTMPTNTCTAAPSASAPPTPIVRRSTQAKPRITACSTPQWNSSVASALMVSTSGRAWKARMNAPPGTASANG